MESSFCFNVVFFDHGLTLEASWLWSVATSTVVLDRYTISELIGELV